MKKALAALGLSLMLAVTSHVTASPEERNPLLLPPFPPASIFAVLMPNQDQCRIVLLRNATRALRFPGRPARVNFLVYLILDTKARLKNGRVVPLTFSFRESLMYATTSASENLSVPCGDISHLDVFEVRCRLQAYDDEGFRLNRGTYDICAPELPRRLNFFGVMEGDPGVPLVKY